MNLARKIRCDELQEGMVLASPVKCKYSYQVLLQKDTVINDSLKLRLQQMNVDNVWVKVDNVEQLDFIEKLNKLQIDEEIKQIYIETYECYEQFTERIIQGKGPVLEPVRKSVEMIVNQIKKNKQVLLSLTQIKSIDEYTFTHSINVAILSIAVAKELGFRQQDLVNLGCGAILHDIGKTCIPDEILNKPDKLTDEEFCIMMEHAQIGFEILKTAEIGAEVIWVIARDHHERLDGSGYPCGRRDKDISMETKLVSITDIYDAVTTERVYRKKMSPDDGIEILFADSCLNKLDCRLVKSFFENIAIYPLGGVVELNNGGIARVISSNPQIPTRPRVEVFEMKNGKEVPAEMKFIDLMNNPTILITRLID